MVKIEVGQKAPSIDGVDQNGKEITLANYEGRKLILFFYPKDNTPTCTVEACNLRDNYGDLKDNGYELLGVSPDSSKKHTNFIEKFELPFPLLADTEHTTMEAYGVWGPKKFMGRTFNGVHRVTFVIDEKGKIEKVIEKVKAKMHSAQIME